MPVICVAPEVRSGSSGIWFYSTEIEKYSIKHENLEHPWVFMDIYIVEFTGKIYSEIIVTSLSMTS
jgi:hypothetical protein